MGLFICRGEVDKMKFNIKPELQYSSCIIVNGYMYFYAVNIKAFVIWKIDSEHCEYLCELKVGNKPISNIDIMLKFKNNIYMLDVSGNYLFCFSTEELSINMLKLPCHKEDYGNYAGAFIIDNQMILVTKELGKMVIINLIDFTIKESINIGYGCICDCGKYENSVFVINDIGELKLFDLIKKTFQVVPIQRLQIDGRGQVFDSTKYCFIDKESKLRVIDIKTGVDLSSEDNSIINKDIAYILWANGKYIVLPSTSEDILVIDDYKKIIFNEYPKDFGYVGKDAFKYWNYAEDDERYYLAQQAANYLVMIEKNTGEFSFRKVIMEPMKQLSLNISRGEISQESDNITLEHFLNKLGE